MTRTQAKPRVLVTAGPTREHIDPVRYLTNESSGRMGFELARAARESGSAVTLIAGPVDLPAPRGVTRVDVVSARDMLRATRRAFRRADTVFMCAAVADWRPLRKRSGKWRKEKESKEVATIELVRNPDILAGLGRRKGARLLIGFALETGAGEARARAKLRAKGADYIVLNDARVLGGERTALTVLGSDGSRRRFSGTKRAAARWLVRLRAPRASDAR
jgi:phosphopantothenoylcysteine decarboxylase/phosphopantothenate--cysteine ligase